MGILEKETVMLKRKIEDRTQIEFLLTKSQLLYTNALVLDRLASYMGSVFEQNWRNKKDKVWEAESEVHFDYKRDH